MNLHPLVVHFPIAFLMMYSVFECIRLRRITEKPYWFNIKAILVIIGFLAALAAAVTGPRVEDPPRILELHQRFATTTILIYGIVALHYFLRWARHEGIHHRIPTLPDWVVILLSLLGLGAIVITGGIGGAMAKGLEFDPFMAPIFRLLGLM